MEGNILTKGCWLSNDGDDEGVYVDTDNDGYKSVNYAQITPILIEAIKELKSEKRRGNRSFNKFHN